MGCRDIARELIKDHEGYRDGPYNDRTGKPVKLATGHLSIGWGHNFDSKPLSRVVLELVLQEDLDDAEKACVELYPFWDSLGDVRNAVLIDMAYNLGKAGLSGFQKLWAAMAEGDWQKAALEILDSRAAQVAGARYRKLALMMRFGLEV